MTNLDSIFKSRDITLPRKVHLVKAMVFPVVMYGCESWPVKKAERWIIDAFVLWFWRRFLRVLWTARRSNQSILKEISPRCSLEGLMIKLKLQYLATSCEELTHWKRLWCWEGLGAGGEREDRGWDGWMASLTQWMWVWVNSGSWWWTGRPGMLQFVGSQRVGHDWATELNWTRLVITFLPRSKHLLISWLQSPSAVILEKLQWSALIFYMGFSCGSAGKESAYNVGDLCLIPGLGRSPGEGKATHSSILAWRMLSIYEIKCLFFFFFFL